MSKNASICRRKSRLLGNKVEFRADPAWINRVDTAAARLGLKRSAYIRMVVSQEMARLEADQGTQTPPGG